MVGEGFSCRAAARARAALPCSTAQRSPARQPSRYVSMSRTPWPMRSRAGTRQSLPLVVGGRYGLSSKEFNPAMAKAVFDHLKKDDPHAGFTVGITDDVCGTSLPVESGFDIEPPGVTRALFFGLGADGTVGANKNSVKILAEDPGHYAQGYFVYDSHKSGAETISHLRFGKAPLAAPYLLQSADFIGVHKFDFLQKIDVLGAAKPGATVLINAPFDTASVWDHLPRTVQLASHRERPAPFRHRRERRCPAPRPRTAREHDPADLLFRDQRRTAAGGGRSAHPPRRSRRAYGAKGRAVLEKNFAAVDTALEHLQEVSVAEEQSPPKIETAGVHPGRRARPDQTHRRAAICRPRRRDPCQRDPGGRQLCRRNDPIREAQYRLLGAGLEAGSLHPMRPMQHCLPAQRDPGQGL